MTAQDKVNAMSTVAIPTLSDLLHVLNSATDQQKIRWEATADEDVFRANVGLGMVRLTKQSDAKGTTEYRLAIIDDQNGIVIEEFQLMSNEEFTAMEALYRKARAQGLDVEWKLKDIYDHLKSLAEEA